MLKSITAVTAQLALVAVASAQSTTVAHWPQLQASTIELTAHWERLTDTTYHFEDQPVIKVLAPATPRASYASEVFLPFLPSAPVAVGASWRVDPTAALPFLRQLHAGASIELHHDRGTGIGARGAWACLRLLDDACMEIMVRIHGEFQIDGDDKVGEASWFTPACFRCRLWIDRKKGQVAAFDLAVPPSRANVDINLRSGHGTIADIGCLPRLQLCSAEFPTEPPTAVQISAAEADRILERRFYPFAKVDWLSLPDALAKSRATGKPMHIVALFGSLCDESC